MSDFKYGDPVKINRPGRRHHGWLARYLQPSATLDGYAEVAVSADGRDRMPKTNDLGSSTRSPRKSFPLSQLEKHEPH